LEACPSCGATLVGGADESLPGLTAVDPVAIVRSKQPVRTRSRLMSWLSGDDGEIIVTPAEGQALAPPPDDVRREMLRLELEAVVANLQAENEAIMAEAAAEGRIVEVPASLLDDGEGAAEGEPASEPTETEPTETGADAPAAEAATAETTPPA
jgi:hypothetical protein